MPTAFVLGAGLGTRLRPLTDRWPKPLVPLAHQPLITWAFRHLAADLGTDHFIINTHHLPEAYPLAFPENSWEGRRISLRHEPTLLDTGGGLANIKDLLPPGESIALYNGDILCDAPLAPLAEAHFSADADATLLLRPSGQLQNVVCQADTILPSGHSHGPILDMRNLRGIDGPRFQFAGIALLGPRYLATLPPTGGIFSLIPHLVDALNHGLKVRGVVVPEGLWSDLGTPQALLTAHHTLLESPFPRYEPGLRHQRIHPNADVAPGTLDEESWAGPDVHVPPGCRVTRSVLLPGATLSEGQSISGALYL